MTMFNPREIDAMIAKAIDRIDYEMKAANIEPSQRAYGRIAKQFTPVFIRSMVEEMGHNSGDPAIIMEGFARAFASSMLSLILSLGGGRHEFEVADALRLVMIDMIKARSLILLHDFYGEQTSVVGNVDQVKGGGRG